MLKIHNVKKDFGGRVLFDGVSFQINSGERLGLVGRNGHGKSTLFKIILGHEDVDEGVITKPKNYRVGHLEQHLKFTKPNVLEEACLGLPPGEEDYIYKAETILFVLGFKATDMERSPLEFSGGYQIRINLAKLLVSEPNLLLLDEPTNYLDIVSVRWLTEFLQNWSNELILISHDRDFMDAVSTHTAGIHRGKLKKIEGGTQKYYDQIFQEEEIHEKTRVNDEKRRKEIEVFISRFRAQASKAAIVQSRIKLLEKMPQLDELESIESLDFEFRYAPTPAKTLLEVKNLTFGYNPDTILFEDLSFTINAGDRIAIVGKNGKGKSTLLNVLAGEHEPLEGVVRQHGDTKLGYFGQTNISRLTPQWTVEQEIQNANPGLTRTQVRNICGTMMFGVDDAEKKVSVLSGGEKSRTLLGKILAHPSNLLFLDEPTNHLDMESIESLIQSIKDFPGAVVIVTHSERILRELANKLVVFHRGVAEEIIGDYEDFLRKIGWDDDPYAEDKKPAKPKGEAVKLSYEEKKAQEKAERQEKKRQDQLVSEIHEREEKEKGIHLKIEEAIANKEHHRLKELSQELESLKSELEALYQKLV